MKTNNLLLILFGLLFSMFGFIFWWVKNKGSQYVSDTANQTISDAKNNFSIKDIILSGGKIASDSILQRLSNKTNTLVK